jgi:hypothetical protein
MNHEGQRGRIDLFDDEPWDSPEGRQELAIYDRLAVSGLPSWVETTCVVVSLGLFAMFVGSVALLFVSIDNYLIHSLQGLTLI